MADIDSNHDGKLTAKDRTFGELKLGVDANSDGKTDADELHGLADFGVVEINLDFAKGSQVDNGNHAEHGVELESQRRQHARHGRRVVCQGQGTCCGTECGGVVGGAGGRLGGRGCC